MSKIFIDHNYKILDITTFSESNSKDVPREIIKFICSNKENNSTKRLLNQLASTIISNRLFLKLDSSLTANDENKNSGNLIPINSRLYAHGSNTNEIPDIETITDLLEIKLKIDNIKEISDDFNYMNDGSAEKLITGHFRFHLPPLIPPQIFILVKSPKDKYYKNSQKLLLFFHGNIKFLSVFTKHIEKEFNCTINDLHPNNQILKSTLNWCIMNDTLNSVGNIELWFGKLKTNGKLGTIVVNIKENDIFNFKDIYLKEINNNNNNNEDEDEDELIILLYEYLKFKTSISFDKLNLIKLKCRLFTITIDGKIKFTSLMSHLGRSAKQSKHDNRLTIWWIIRHLFLVK